MSGNGFVGVIVEQSHDNEVAGNDIFRNSTGIILFASRNAITGNQVADSVSCPDGCGVGISLEGGEGNLIARNDVAAHHTRAS